LQTEIYKEKAQECNPEISSYIDELNQASSDLIRCSSSSPSCFSEALKNLKEKATALNDENRYAECQIF